MQKSNSLILWSITASLAGFIFGFDMVVISGAEQAIQELWGLSDIQHGFAISSAVWGTVIGALLGGVITNYFGRKVTLISVGVLYLVSALWSAFSPTVLIFILARALGGLGIGISTVASPLFITEIAPASKRGKLSGMFQFNIVFGILIAFASNALLSNIEHDSWRWMLGVESFPAVIYSLLCFTLPESPRWLVMVKGQSAKAEKVLSKLYPTESSEELNKRISQFSQTEASKESSKVRGQKSLWRPILLAFVIAMFNQLSGINAILYYAPRIFELSGLEAQASLLQSIGIGVTNLIFTFVGLGLIDKVGRKLLLYVGSIGYIISLGICSWAFQKEVYTLVPYCIFVFIASHAVGQGAVIWVFISEIFPSKFRAYGQAIGCSTHWVLAALMTQFFPLVVKNTSPSFVFMFFAGMMVLQLLWVKYIMPETKGRSLEDLESNL